MLQSDNMRLFDVPVCVVFGVGFGCVSGFITMPVILQQLTGPANFGLVDGQSQYFAVCSS